MKEGILTTKAIQIINKKLRNQKLSQQDSNYLSRFVRPKLRNMLSINAKYLLKRLEYNPRSLSIESKIKKIILKNIPNVNSITICGSAIQTNYQDYNDIDIIIATKKILKEDEKKELIRIMEREGKELNLNLDLQIYSKESILSQYSSNPSLIYQLKDSKTIYGKLEIPKRIELMRLQLKMKLDWSEGVDIDSDANEIYYAIRNAMMVLLLMNKKIDNTLLKENIENSLGLDLTESLRNNKAIVEEKRLALSYLNLLLNYLEKELKKPKWEKIKIESH